MTPPTDPCHRHRFPGWVMAHAAWLHHAFGLRLRDVELMLAERGVTVSHETIRRWCRKFAGPFTERLRGRRPRPGAAWHLDEVFARVAGGRRLYLWRAVDQRGAVLGAFVQARRDAAAAKRFLARPLARMGFAARVLVTGGLRSCAAARREVLPGVAHRIGRWLNDRAEEAHRPVRRRERRMQRFKSAAQAQRFLSAHGVIRAHFRPPRHRMSAADCRRARTRAFRVWREETCARTAA